MTEDEEAKWLLVHTEYKEYYKNGQPSKHFWTKNGELDGEYKWFWEDDGILSAHRYFKDDCEVADFIKHPELKKEYGIDD